MTSIIFVKVTKSILCCVFNIKWVQMQYGWLKQSTIGSSKRRLACCRVIWKNTGENAWLSLNVSHELTCFGSTRFRSIKDLTMPITCQCQLGLRCNVCKIRIGFFLDFTRSHVNGEHDNSQYIFSLHKISIDQNFLSRYIDVYIYLNIIEISSSFI